MKYRKEEKEEEYPEKELYDEEGRRLIDLEKHRKKDGEYDIDLYDKNGRRITNLKKYVNEEGDITIPVYDKDKNVVVNMQMLLKKLGQRTKGSRQTSFRLSNTFLRSFQSLMEFLLQNLHVLQLQLIQLLKHLKK